VTGTAESVGRAQREQVVAFHPCPLSPDATVIAVVGDVGVTRSVRRCRAVSRWTAPRAWTRPSRWPTIAARRRRDDQPRADAGDRYLGRPAIRQDHPDYFPLLVANYILGGGSRRVVHARREDAGLAYAWAARCPRAVRRVVHVLAQTRVDGVAEPCRLVKDEMAAMGRVQSRSATSGSPSRIDRQLPLRLDTSSKVAETLTAIESTTSGSTIRSLQTSGAGVTRSDVERVAARYLDPATFSSVIVGK